MINQQTKLKLKELGNFCRSIRLDRNYTQREVAQEIIIPQYKIQAFEAGNRNEAIILLWYINNCDNFREQFNEYINKENNNG